MSSPYHRIIMSPYHRIIILSYHRIITSPYRRIIISPYHRIFISSYHHVTISSYYYIIISLYHHIVIFSWHHAIILSYRHIITVPWLLPLQGLLILHEGGRISELSASALGSCPPQFRLLHVRAVSEKQSEVSAHHKVPSPDSFDDDIWKSTSTDRKSVIVSGLSFDPASMSMTADSKVLPTGTIRNAGRQITGFRITWTVTKPSIALSHSYSMTVRGQILSVSRIYSLVYGKFGHTKARFSQAHGACSRRTSLPK